jgi:hypothetical protein
MPDVGDTGSDTLIVGDTASGTPSTAEKDSGVSLNNAYREKNELKDKKKQRKSENEVFEVKEAFLLSQAAAKPCHSAGLWLASCLLFWHRVQVLL